MEQLHSDLRVHAEGERHRCPRVAAIPQVSALALLH